MTDTPDSVRETIASRFRAGDSVALLANDYDRPVEQIEAAIRSAIPDPAHACIMCDGTGQLNGMRLNSYSDLEAENVKLRERCARQRRELRRLNRSVVPTRLVSRCNAPEPSASVPRSEDSGKVGDANAEDVREHCDRNSSDNGWRVGAEALLKRVVGIGCSRSFVGHTRCRCLSCSAQSLLGTGAP